jgi:cytoskeleton protein RodZ
MTDLTNMSTDEEGGQGRRRIHLREITGAGELPLETVGQDLRAARLRRGDDLASVSKALKIRKDHLEALEEDRLDSLPGKTYAIGFVRSYSQYLGLDPAALVERFKQEISGRTDEHALPPPPAMHEEEPRRLPQGWRLIALVVVLLLAYGAYHLFTAERESSQNTPPPPTETPKVAAAVAPAQATPSPAIDASGAAPGGATPSPAASAPAPTSPSQPAATPSPAAGAPAAGGPAVGPAAGGNVYGQQNRNPHVVLRARSATHITVRGNDGTLYINRDLAAGDSYQVRNMSGLTLSTTNGGAVEIDLDGQSMGNAGSDQQPADSLSLDPQAISDHFNSRRPG